MSRFLFSTAFLAIFGLTACEDSISTTPVAGTAPATVPGSQMAPGTEPLPLQTAVDFFSAICTSRAPSFAGAEGALAANSFVQNPATNSWFHPDLNVSFNVSDRCSMVFGGHMNEDYPAGFFIISVVEAGLEESETLQRDSDRIGVTAPGPQGTIMTIRPRAIVDGDVLYHAVLARP